MKKTTLFKYLAILLVAILGLIVAYQMMTPSSVSQNTGHERQKSPETSVVEEPKSVPDVTPTMNASLDDHLLQRIVITVVGVSVISLALWWLFKINQKQGDSSKLVPDDKILK